MNDPKQIAPEDWNMPLDATAKIDAERERAACGASTHEIVRALRASQPIAPLSLDDISKIAREHSMTPAERREQRISFVYGMRSSHSTHTKDDVRRIMEEMGQ